MTDPRPVCLRCRRPDAVCYCAHLVPLLTRTRVVFLQHPREARVPIGTARMAHLMLPNSEIHQGVRFGDHPRVRELAADPRAALLYPGEGARDPATIGAGEVETLVVVDGTWAQARKLLKENPLLAGLPRVGLLPERPGNYRIRREPTEFCLATIEAVSQVLGVLERDPPRLAAMLAAFTFMVDRQIEEAAARTGSARHRRGWAERAAEAATALRERLDDAVVVHAEVNSYPRGSGERRRPELLHLVARRLATGQRFEAFLAPQRELAKSAAFHLGLDPAQLLAGEPVTTALGRFAAFVGSAPGTGASGPGPVCCGWGHYTRDQLRAEGLDAGDWLDLRVLVARRLQASAGAPWQAAQALRRAFGGDPEDGDPEDGDPEDGDPEDGDPPVASAGAGRAGRMVAELAQIVALLRAAAVPGRRPARPARVPRGL